MTRAKANHLLDLVRAGHPVPDSEILFALWVTGEFAASPFKETDTQENPGDLLEMESQ
jgi:hypothetical protein